MKKLLFLLTLIIVLFCSCHPNVPIFNSKEHPFIVEKMKASSRLKGYTIYTSKEGTGYVKDVFWANCKAEVVLPTNWFQIGDTIKF